VQEVITRSGWTSGNSLAFILTGTGHRTADAFDKSGGTSPILNISYLANQPAVSFAKWMISHPTLIGPNAGPTANPDGDSFNNLLEYALATNPAQSNAAPYTLSAGNGLLFFTYTRPSLAPDLTYTVEWSDTLAPGSWSTIGVAQQVLSDDGTKRTVQAFVESNAAARRFLRLKVTSP
jgi:hypothetical protein